MKRLFAFTLLVAVVFMNGCQKETSYEVGGASEGTLQSDVSDDCLPKTLTGNYEEGTALNGNSNQLLVTVDVIKTGAYTVYTDTVNGVYFLSTGTFSAIGSTSVTLKGFGTPLGAGTFNFNVIYKDGDTCTLAIPFLPTGAGGPAAFTLQTTGTGTPPNCSGATAAGSYIIGSPLNSSNTVTLSVNVTTIGSYSITSSPAVNGMTFAKSGVFLTTGIQNVVLVGSGTPTGTAGSVTVPITVGSTTCNFQVTTVAGAAFSFNCSSAVVNGTYQAGVDLNSGNTIDIDVTVTSPGPYNISTSINGMTFTASGTFVVGTTTISLAGTGKPTSSGTFNLPFGSPVCNVPINCTAAPTVDWKFTEGSTTYQGGFESGSLDVVAVPPISITAFTYMGNNAAGEEIMFILGDIAGGIKNGESYSSSTTTTNSVSFLMTDASLNTLYQADPSMTGLTFKVTVTTHNTSTKTITGTFSGTVKNGAGTTKTITSGTFKGTYP